MSADTLILGAWSFARLAVLPRNRVHRAMDDGRLLAVASDGLRGQVSRYVVLDGDGAARLDRFLARQHEGTWPVPLGDIEAPRTNGGTPWFRSRDVERAGRAGAFGFHRRHGVVMDGRWLRWAAAHMPGGERAAILGSLIVHDKAAQAGTP